MKQWIELVECPRDAMQGWKQFIPTEKKVRYLNTLLKVGFHTLDFGSFVSPKAIPQMADTKDVIRELNVGSSTTRLLAIVANIRGAAEACSYELVKYLGFPFSISNTFQLRNTNSTIEHSFNIVQTIHRLCTENKKQLVVYISMGFGNPYGDPYDEKIVIDWVRKLTKEGIQVISLADTVGIATPEQVERVTQTVIESFPGITVGVHLHSTPVNHQAKLEAAVKAGCQRFDGALKGIGGCPLANDELVGNMNSELMIPYFEEKGLLPPLNKQALSESIRMAGEIFLLGDRRKLGDWRQETGDRREAEEEK